MQRANYHLERLTRALHARKKAGCIATTSQSDSFIANDKENAYLHTLRRTQIGKDAYDGSRTIFIVRRNAK